MATESSLAQKQCVPCKKGDQPMSPERARALLKDVPGWQVSGGALRREFVMKDFIAAVRLIDEISKVAESQDHHPDLHLTSYRRLAVELSTHSIGGLSENDFILAAKIEQLPREEKLQ